MSAWGLLSIPGTLLLLSLVLFLSDLAERSSVSPQALILRAATGRRTHPDQAEALVAAEVDRILERQT